MKKLFWFIGATLIVIAAWFGLGYRQYTNHMSRVRTQMVVKGIEFQPYLMLSTMTPENITLSIDNYIWDWKRQQIIRNPAGGASRMIVSGADYASFVPLDQQWAQDNNRLYLLGKATDIVSSSRPRVGYHNFYITSTKGIYSIEGRLLSGIDTPSFEFIHGDGGHLSVFSKDKSHIYVAGKLLTGSDHDTFRVYSRSYARDKSHIYYYHTPVTGADVATFHETYPAVQDDQGHILYDAQDQTHSYYQGKVVEKGGT